MPEYLHPGVYVEEIERGPRPIEGVATSIPAMIGATERGPITARAVTSLAEFERLFGGAEAPGFLPAAVRGFFDNGGAQTLICRTTDPGAATWYADLGTHLALAIGPGDWGSRVTLRVEPGATSGLRVTVAYFAAGQSSGKPQYDEIFEGVADVAALNSSSRLVTFRAKANPAPGGVTQRSGPLDLTLIDPSAPRGLALLDDPACNDVSLVYSPAADDATQRALVAHCEANRHRFAVLDAPRGTAPQDLQPRTSVADSNRAALYWPWLWILDANGQRQLVPPGGHVLGIYARTDRDRSVHKAPANEVVSGAIDLESVVTEQAQEPLNLRGVDVIRRLPGRGIRVWGARTLSSDPEWKYVNVRRFFDYLEHSIDKGTQWVVFEPNDEPTWARVRDVVTLFLRTQWRSGALLGVTEDQAFFVRCDRTTMAQDDIDNGRLICEIGIAPVKPAEFVIFRIRQKTAET